MPGQSEFRAAIEAGDFKQLRRISEEQEPHLPRLTDSKAELVMHQARTSASSLPLKMRAWSHRWLVERGHESLLPDQLRPSAEQICPRIVSAVGIALKTTNPLFAEAMPLIRHDMEQAVRDADADGKLDDSDFVRARMMEAKQKSLHQLFGRIGE